MALAISNRCNTDCVMCWEHSPLLPKPAGQAAKGRRPAFMDGAVFETILREARRMGTFRVVLGGDGEPTLHPDFDRMLELMGALRMEPYVLTNGIVADEGRAEAWARSRAHFRFSVNAGDEETWLRVHPSGTPAQFQRLCRLIGSLAAAGEPRVSTMHVIHVENFRNVRAMLEHARSLGVREVLYRPIRLDHRAGELASLVLDPDQEAELRRELRRCLALARQWGIRTNVAEYLHDNLNVHAGWLSTGHLYREIPCFIGWIYAEFDLEGAMTPCLHSKIVMGRAGRDPIRELWHSARYDEFRHAALTMPQRGRLMEGCSCNACCMAKFNVNIYNLLRLKSFGYQAA